MKTSHALASPFRFLERNYYEALVLKQEFTKFLENRMKREKSEEDLDKRIEKTVVSTYYLVKLSNTIEWLERRVKETDPNYRLVEVDDLNPEQKQAAELIDDVSLIRRLIAVDALYQRVKRLDKSVKNAA